MMLQELARPRVSLMGKGSCKDPGQGIKYGYLFRVHKSSDSRVPAEGSQLSQ
jgi:hypothetical protein